MSVLDTRAGLAPAQQPTARVPVINTPAGTTVGNASMAVPLAAQRTSAPADGELKLVVALFRHGIRAPLNDFAEEARKHSAQDWPNQKDWGVQKWGDLTPQGRSRASTLGGDYSSFYQPLLGNGFNAYLWADVDQRTRDTADALADGLRNGGVHVDVSHREPITEADPLFHPFKARCGTPIPATPLSEIASDIRAKWRGWWTDAARATSTGKLVNVLACPANSSDCTPVDSVVDDVRICSTYADKTCESPVVWKGRFSYASGASEAFLLEFANGMPKEKVGWGRVPPPPPDRSFWNLRSMLELHEFYFDKTERQIEGPNPYYLAKIQASNLIREILDQVKRKAGLKPDGGCPRADSSYRFVGFIGHDTNLAGVGALLRLSWRFVGQDVLPPNTWGLPPNDALPAGALVFELRERDGRYMLRILYVTQTLGQMHGGEYGPAVRLRVEGPDCRQDFGGCDIPLDLFIQRAEAAIDGTFLSGCSADPNPRQVCTGTRSRGRRRRGSR